MENINFRSSCALLWRRILNTDPKHVFSAAEYQRLMRRHSGDILAQPGYVGANFQPGGIVFVAMNPGNGGDGRGDEDLRMYQSLEALRDVPESGASAAFDKLTAALAEIMPTWKIFANFVAPILPCKDLRIGDVAYVNLLKWRTDSSERLEVLFRRSWEAHTREQLRLLRPGRVIAIQRGAGRPFVRLDAGATRIDIIPGVIGGNIGPSGREVIARICASA